MDSSVYYYNGHQDDDSPTLSPLSSTFDRYLGRGDFEDSSFFDLSPTNATFSSIPTSVAYSITPRVNPGTVNYIAADSYQDQYLGDPLNLGQPLANTSNPVPYPEQIGGDARVSSTLDSNSFFLPSPPEADESSCYPSPDTVSDRQSEKRKRRSRQASKSIKSEDSEPPMGDLQHTQRPTTQLRTASRSQKRPSATSLRKMANAPEDVKARATHNHVEQQYRKRLNAQFEKLLAVLPQSDYQARDPGSDDDGRGGGQKRMSKAEVLDLARRRIKTLESERAVLEKQKRDLAGCVEKMRDEWTRRLGGEVPIMMEG